MTAEEIIEKAKKICFSSNPQDYIQFVGELAELKPEQLSANLDEAAEKYAWRKEQPLEDGERLSYCFNPRIEAFKAGAEWMVEQTKRKKK